MPENKEEIEIRSDEVQEIMSHVPNWMIRRGITLFFGLICLFIFITWFIKYPDVVNGSVILTTVEPPIKLVAKNTGEINQLYFEENAVVKKGDLLATLNNSLTKEAKLYLEKINSEIKFELQKGALETYEVANSSFVFGGVQVDYSNLIKGVADYKYLVNENNTQFKIANLKKQIHNHQMLKSVTQKQLNSSTKQLEQAKEKYNSDKELYKKGVYSKMQFYQEEKEFNLAKNAVENLEKATIQHAITLTDLEKQLNDLEFNFEKQKGELLQGIAMSLANIENAIANWELDFQIKAPIDGTITYLQSLSQNEFVTSGKELFAIVPNNQDYIGQIKIQQAGYGKIEVGQKVRIKLDNFPYQEYGQLDGAVKEISVIPNEESYLVKVTLLEGVKSSYNKELTYTPEMAGTAEIITKDLRLMERIFNKFRKILDK